MPPSAVDVRHMARCLELAAAKRGRASPNPMVGCVIVDRRGRVVAEGAHDGPGKPHAEIVALRKLGKRVPVGATLYVNLEPCNHHGRTPPCAPALVEAGVARVVVAARDPIAGHRGGVELLRRHGIEVVLGVGDAAALELNRGFYAVARKGRPFVSLKAATSLDGRIATAQGESQWITGPAARQAGMALRAAHDAIAVGIGTVLADDPRLSVRGQGRSAVREKVVFDSRLRLPNEARLLRTPGRTIVVASHATLRSRAGRGRAEVLRAMPEVAVVGCPTLPDGRLVVAEALRGLAEQGVTSVYVEGGGRLHASFIESGLYDALHLFVAPMVIGHGPGWISGLPLGPLEVCPRLTFARPPVLVGKDVWLELRNTAAF